MLPNINSRQAKQLMRRMGIKSEDIDATEVIIRTPDKEIVITNPSVSKVDMMGQKTFQVAGDIEERAASTEPDINEEDIETVMEQTGCTKKEALKAIKETNGDLAEAILKLKK